MAITVFSNVQKPGGRRRLRSQLMCLACVAAVARVFSAFLLPASLSRLQFLRPQKQAGTRNTRSAMDGLANEEPSASLQVLPGVKNVLGLNLTQCSSEPVTGWLRDGFCRTDEYDQGRHLVCVSTTAEFLEYQRQIGNDLSTPAPMYGFPGLSPGDNWCVCASRWAEAVVAGISAPIKARATHIMAADYAPEETLRRFAIDL
eukprot:TRINITY_DN72666_c0_g1_i1.p1 TRINITY_DN72666_c0_g1~~TRINITY_DN72666_c0_g1_i1.p1  ORF type:complete len:202 (-),score=20.13 TRINITY_DN72666_c0_g1_i1:268-873(-)